MTKTVYLSFNILVNEHLLGSSSGFSALTVVFVFTESEVPDTVVRKLLSPRQQVFMELLQTESNYVGILHTIVMVRYSKYLLLSKITLCPKRFVRNYGTMM